MSESGRILRTNRQVSQRFLECCSEPRQFIASKKDGENLVPSVAFILLNTWLLRQTESGIRLAVRSGVDVLVCVPASPTGIQAIVRALVTITRLSAVSIRTLATAIRLPAVTVRTRPSAIHLIDITAGARPSAIPPFAINRWSMATTIYTTTVCVRALVTTIGIPTSCVLALVAIIVMPTFCVRALVAMFGTTVLVTIVAVTPAGLIPETGAVVLRRMTFLVVMPLIPGMTLVTVIVTRTGSVPVIVCQLQQGCIVNRLAVLIPGIGNRIRTGLYTAAVRKAGKAKHRCGNRCD